MGVCVVVTLRNLKIEHFDAYFSIIKIAVSAAMARLWRERTDRTRKVLKPASHEMSF